MTEPRQHTFALTVSFDRPITYRRAKYLLEEAVNKIGPMGRDLTRPGHPEAKLIRAETKDIQRMVSSKLVDRNKKRDDETVIRLAELIKARLASGAFDFLLTEAKEVVNGNSEELSSSQGGEAQTGVCDSRYESGGNPTETTQQEGET